MYELCLPLQPKQSELPQSIVHIIGAIYRKYQSHQLNIFMSYGNQFKLNMSARVLISFLVMTFIPNVNVKTKDYNHVIRIRKITSSCK